MSQFEFIETILMEELQEKFGQVKGLELFGEYTSARKVVIDEIAPEIKAIEPGLTDHGPKHINNVLQNAYKLLGNYIEEMTAMELYVLCLSIIFHDVGNIEKRTGHNKKLSAVYNYVRNGGQSHRREKDVVSKITEAHCGQTSSGSRDTLKVVPSTMELQGESIRSREIAALLRFADELAEGPQRTSGYMQDQNKYPEDSLIHHKYASTISDLSIIPSNEKVAVTFDINLSIENNKLVFDDKIDLVDFLQYIFDRILKLDQERKYTKHYCNWLNPFKSTSIGFHFWLDGEKVDLNLNPIVMSDLTVPGEDAKMLSDYDSAYTSENIIEQLNKFVVKEEG